MAPISNKGTQLSVETIYGDDCLSNLDSRNLNYDRNQQRGSRSGDNANVRRLPVFGRNKVPPQSIEVAPVDTDEPVVLDKAIDEAIQQDLRKRNIK